MPSNARLIVGLGNPGPEYAHTRHNIGFVVADRVGERAGLEFETAKFNAVFGRGSWRGRPFVIAKPTAFMNRSGRPVASLLRHLGITPQEVLIVYDDIHLPAGEVRLRAKGGSGGHNGIEDVIRYFGTSAFPRLRIGIGNEFGRGGQSDYVLSEFDSEQKPLMVEAVDVAEEAALCFVTDGITTAMNRYNRKNSTD
ncbi:MAG: aminoacyl-tRNA hydrolase [Rhodothermia bacterium]|nr:aminoacyl-tRNA hydrolase [Rhodothermia bacterium]